jgi:hypothetical protein
LETRGQAADCGNGGEGVKQFLGNFPSHLQISQKIFPTFEANPKNSL